MVYMDALDADEASYNLKVRECPEGKLEEIRRDQMWAKERGVKSLRRKLLPLNKRIYYAVRQLIMEHDSLREKFPKIVGNGQIMKK
jgi:hypothetical protein